MDLIVETRTLSKSYGNRFSLGPLTLSIGLGVNCVVGPNGAGKTTLFGLMAGTVRPTSGSVQLPDSSDRLGLLPQEFRLPPRATCAQFLAYVAWLQGIPPSDRAGVVEASLTEVDLLELADIPIHELSGGMVKRLGIAQALVHDPAVLILDEPTAGLDPIQRIAIREVVADLGSRRIVCVSTHLVEDVRSFANRILVLNEGSLVFDGDTPTLARLSDPTAPGDSDLERALSSLMLKST